MRLSLTGRQVEITPALRRLVERKVARVERVLTDKAVSGQVELSQEKFRRVADVQVHARGGHLLQGHAVATSWGESLSTAVDRLVQQAQKMKGKWLDRKREATPAKRRSEAPLVAARVRRIVRARSYPIRPMSLEAAAQMVGPTADAFVIFRNDRTDAIGVLYRRKDGDLGLIEPGA